MNRFREDRARRKAARTLQVHPGHESAYVLAVTGILGAAHRAVLQVVERERLAPPELHTDLAPTGPGRPAVGLGGELTSRLFEWQRPRVQLAFDFMAKKVDKRAAEALKVMGIAPRHIAGVDSMIEHARARNVTLIRDATQGFIDEVKDILEETEGMAPAVIRAALEGRVGVSRSRARLIARDQTLKMNSQIAQHRARSAGVSRYQWSGSLDERERPMHLALEGQVFSWDQPPVTNEDGDTNNPGEDFQCRCVGLPVIDELENIAEEPAAAEEEEEENLPMAAEEEE